MSLSLNLRSGIRRLRNRVPVERLFTKIFLWFWLTALVLLAMFAGTRMIGLRSLQSSEIAAAFAPRLAAEAAQAYESGGPKAFKEFVPSLLGNQLGNQEGRIYLLDGFGKDVLSRSLNVDSRLVANAARSGGPVIVQSRLRTKIAAYRFTSSSGRPYTVVLYRSVPLGSAGEGMFVNGIPFFLCLLLVVTGLCLGLAYHIATPVHGIQSAARRVAQGDLSARAPGSISRRHDELASLADDFNSMVEQLAALIRTQRGVLNSVSHELRSPLARLTLCLALIRKQSSFDSEELLVRAERDIARIDTLITQLLTLSRYESGLTSSVRELVNLSQLVEEIAADGNFEAAAVGKSVSLEVDGCLIVEDADAHALRSACENIVRNAIRFSPPGGQIEMVLKTDGDAHQALLSVRDCGPGVPEECLNEIFQPFFRVNRPKELQDGNGLGLAIALEAVKLNGGSIAAYNRMPSGLAIEMQLPISKC